MGTMHFVANDSDDLADMDRWEGTPVKLVGMVLMVATLSLAFRPASVVTFKPLSEDGYYALNVSKNIARGLGITIDGVHATNGFQPLFTFLCVPAFMLSEDDVLGVRAVLALEGCFLLATAYLLGSIARDAIQEAAPRLAKRAFWYTATIYLASITILRMHMNGLETGATLFFYCLAWRYYQRTGKWSWKSQCGLGVILGLLVLTRIDTVFLVILAACMPLMIKKRPWKTRLGWLLTVGGTALLISAPWWCYNLIGFGSLMPSSGKAQQALALSLDRVVVALKAIVQLAVPFFYLGRFADSVDVAARVAILVAGTFLIRRWWPAPRRPIWNERCPVRGRTLEFAFLMLLSTGILVVWYVVDFWTVHFYPRYFAPILLPTVVVTGWLAARASLSWPRLAAGTVAAMCALSLWSIGLWWMGYLDTGDSFIRIAVPLVKSHVPPHDYVAAAQSGTLGFFRDRVVNVDGKVNPEALKHQKDMRAYLRSRQVLWFCDWDGYCRRYLGAIPEDHGWRLVAKADAFRLYHYGPP